MWRKTLAGLESALALAALAGSIQLAAGIATPPDSDLPPGLSSWALPAAWLFATVAVPSGAPALAAWRRDARTPRLVVIASAALALELVVQIPFLGFSWLQAGCAAVALMATWLALRTTP